MPSMAQWSCGRNWILDRNNLSNNNCMGQYQTSESFKREMDVACISPSLSSMSNITNRRTIGVVNVVMQSYNYILHFSTWTCWTETHILTVLLLPKGWIKTINVISCFQVYDFSSCWQTTLCSLPRLVCGNEPTIDSTRVICVTEVIYYF